MENMAENHIIRYFEGRTMLITGATGFLGKVFLEKILRIQPNVRKVYVLLRSTPARNAQQRLHEEIMSTELFRVLKEKSDKDANSVPWGKVIPVSGDVSCENLGIVDSELLDEMWSEIDIIVHSAAKTVFDDRYDKAFLTNSMGPMHIANFSRKCAKAEMLLSVSTAYVQGNRPGLIPEKLFQMGETLPGAKKSYLDINMEKKIVDERLRELRIQNVEEKEITRIMKDLGVERANLHGWPNTYSLTKAMGEMLLQKFKDKVKVIIIRPTIITSTYADPFPGWIEGLRTLDSIFATFGARKLKFFVGDPDSILDMIPGDMVVNLMLAAMASHSTHNILVYHAGSSFRNVMKLGELKWIFHRYLTKNPLLDKKGKPIKIGKPTTFATMVSFHKYMAIHYKPIESVLGVTNMIFCNHIKEVYVEAKRKINRAMRLAALYEPYLFFHGIFEDFNAETLRRAIKENNMDVDVLNFDPSCIVWEEYFMETHFPGLIKHVLK